MSSKQQSPRVTLFTDPEACRLNQQLATRNYQTAWSFSGNEQYGLTSQMRRSCVSATSNIAEGFSRRTKKDKVQFYVMAVGSLTELQNQLLVSRGIKLIAKASFKQLADNTVYLRKLLAAGLIKSAQTKKELQ